MSEQPSLFPEPTPPQDTTADQVAWIAEHAKDNPYAEQARRAERIIEGRDGEDLAGEQVGAPTPLFPDSAEVKAAAQGHPSARKLETLTLVQPREVGDWKLSAEERSDGVIGLADARDRIKARKPRDN